MITVHDHKRIVSLTFAWACLQALMAFCGAGAFRFATVWMFRSDTQVSLIDRVRILLGTFIAWFALYRTIIVARRCLKAISRWRAFPGGYWVYVRAALVSSIRISRIVFFLVAIITMWAVFGSRSWAIDPQLASILDICIPTRIRDSKGQPFLVGLSH